ncbi:hypothetical protein EVB51_082 [Rhizobium phage RHph_Y17]|uniref:Uncharacterized protein n=2 Tax=Kleczkowskavirus RHEph4 TaxID=1921526 RepID=A0A7S5R8I1_9CAUD|nr:hypothetical protein EVB51_082 [Rhizobium phage RHph_Y17]QIG69018.1 hypothetical protein EVB73_082 [Rhizobium phage RHph_Y3_43]QIG69567.1 hypothetical protein EVB80_084 [Rhizobium phage RHph_I36]QIG75441.1 hypothetical protein EVC17_084 [Rhizobium phage RHph_Y1_1]QIG75991.1 hypothetical protein EVC21_084 [Rhizobium phage RHph_Y2_17_2]QXV74953.1 hypothetical protein [Rhizobium phage RHEph26]
MKDLAPGDKIEVRFATHDGYIWNPAVVSEVREHKFCVAYPDGKLHVLERGTNHYRRPHNGAVS